MILTPATRDELAVALRVAEANRVPIRRVDLRRLDRLLRYAPEDLTVTVEAGITLAALQRVLRQHRQWLPIDPPGAETLTIAALLDQDLSGPRRFGHGTIREYLIGLRVALADGRIIHSGGEVVKNVAGYDLMKLFVGARGSLGVIVEAAFKLLPVPETEHLVSLRCATWEMAGAAMERIMDSPLVPTIFDLHNIGLEVGSAAMIVLGLAGTRLEVEWQLARAAELGLRGGVDLAYESRFNSDTTSELHRRSVLPSRLIEAIAGLGDARFVARAGNGLIQYRGGTGRTGDLAVALTAHRMASRVKRTYDPHSILPPEPVAW